MRRRKAPEREISLDPKYNSKTVTKFVNMVMTRGKKSIAERIVYGAFEIMRQKLNDQDALKLFHKAIDNVRPRLEVKPRRVGGATYQVPIEVRQDRGTSISMRWLRDFARNKKGKAMVDRLADELVSAYKGEGSAIKKRDDMHKMAESNKAYAHFRW
ncbi:MAG: 30S ribosomal protein S7 [Omnitrophica WOR_2 bacterium GWB2_45_9]|nr:30S ribosomal protein S7 [Candidatus Omnitrophota bacterium]OGX11412.1 MAG: 30S ribosomal protein S7 [Omnitrophica WOR_2 bacterium GWB2_45_9]OGX45713.1 MAG: 30S ribosomal protein S7 [Omnitrophica WOR_2 bacterium RIFOXYA2_FULL_45_12]OGX53824.1 MAG: 30S ribosomal protein S7 [Omnitrophica WOR_2 bacterium RIFOXYB2_FULL_45_11]OGX59917.1 MAG: 30S ribosomal protein S7 [Omnitrophica WOR_2 bacterium RIFOXYC2_FULL_45_15]